MRDLFWLGDSKKVLSCFPQSVKDVFGQALFEVQLGGHPDIAKPLKGLGGGVYELVDDFNGDTYRAVYIVALRTGIFVLHVFMKKSVSGNATPQREIDLVRARLKRARDVDAGNG